MNIQEELKKCGNDIGYFLEKYTSIYQRGKLVPFKLTDNQKELINHLSNKNISIARSTRQSGLTSGILGHLLHQAIFYGKNIEISSYNRMSSQDTISKLKDMFYSIPDGILYTTKIIKKESNRNNITFTNGAKISLIKDDNNKPDIMVLDDAAYHRNLEITGRMKNAPQLILASTKKNKDINNNFNKLWLDAIKGDNDFHPFDLHIDNSDEQIDELIKNHGHENYINEYTNTPICIELFEHYRENVEQFIKKFSSNDSLVGQILHNFVFGHNTKIMFMSNNSQYRGLFIENFRTLYNSLPDMLKETIKVNNKYEFGKANNIIRAVGIDDKYLRGHTINVLAIDSDRIPSKLSNAMSALSNTKIIIMEDNKRIKLNG